MTMASLGRAILTASVAVPAVARDRPYNELVNLRHDWSVMSECPQITDTDERRNDYSVLLAQTADSGQSTRSHFCRSQGPAVCCV